MLSIVMAALRSRRSSTVALWLLACFVIAGAVGAPFDVYGAEARIAAQDVTDAPAVHRMIILSESDTVTGATGPATIESSMARLRGAITVPGAVEVSGLRVSGSLGAPVNTSVAIASRAGVCGHVAVTGRCPNALGDVMVSRSLASALGVGVGDSLTWPADSIPTRAPQLRVVGVYEPVDVTDPYWGKGLFAATAPVGSPTADAMFVSDETVRAYAEQVISERLLIVTPAAIAGSSIAGSSIAGSSTGPVASSMGAAGSSAAGVDAIIDRLGQLRVAVNSRFQLDEDFQPLADRIGADMSTVSTNIPVLAAELVVLGWFALFLVLRAAAAGRRGDLGLALLRGSSRLGLWRLFGLQNAIPVLAALPIGAAAGYLAARWLAGPVPASDERLASAIAIGAALIVAAGALVAASIAEHRARRTPILELLRRTPPAHRGWRGNAVDAVVVAVAAFGLVQSTIGGTAEAGASGGAFGIAAATPALLGVALALAVSRLIAPVAGRLIPTALRSGSATRLLTAAQLARRPGLDRVFALIAIAVVLVATSVLSWRTAADAQANRAVETLGADRVLQVRDASPQRVLTVTRTADPSGRYAMAAAEYGGNVLAVDSARLGTVLVGGPGWPDGEHLAAALRPALSPPMRLSNGSFALAATASVLPARPTLVAVDLVDDSGAAHVVEFGPLSMHRSRYAAVLDGCPNGCALVDLRLAEPGRSDGSANFPVVGVSIVVSGLTPAPSAGSNSSVGSAATPAALDIATFGDRSAWRTSTDADALGPALAAGSDGLHIDLPTGETRLAFARFDPRVFPANVALPVPVVVAGTLPAPRQAGVADIDAFGDATAPVHVGATAGVLPQLGTAGTYVDLTAALRIDGGRGVGGVPQIWLRADTPASVLGQLRSAGLVVVSDTTLASAEASFQRQAPQAVLRFALAIALVAMLAAITALIVLASIERESRAAELTALRRHGLSTRVVAMSSYAGYLMLAASAASTGLLAVIAAHLFIPQRMAVFADGYGIPPAPHATPVGWVLAILAAGVPLILAGAYAASRLIRATRREPTGGRT
jgi:putative ABC transport system permease protein